MNDLLACHTKGIFTSIPPGTPENMFKLQGKHFTIFRRKYDKNKREQFW